MNLVISGTDMITSVGKNTTECFESFCKEKNGLSTIKNIRENKFNYAYSYEISDQIIKLGELRTTELIIKTIQNILTSKGSLKNKKIDIVIGTGLKETRGIEKWFNNEIEFSPEDNHFGKVKKQFQNIINDVHILSGACSASLYAVGIAEDILKLEQADIVIVVGADVLVESMVGYLDKAFILPPDKLMPFNKKRVGTMLGEGVASIILESEDTARERGAQPLAYLKGVGLNCDAYHETSPDLEGILSAMEIAHRRSGTQPDEIDLILAHATGTVLNDQTEIQAIKKLYSNTKLDKTIISGIKGMTGHTSGASGLIGLITGIESIKQRKVPPTLFLDEPMDEVKDLIIPKQCIENVDIEKVQVNAFGFGGVNAVAILESISQGN